MSAPRPHAAGFLVALVVLAAVFAAAGCGKKGTLSPNRAPETTVFVSGDLDTVRHIVRLSWFGTDPDGEVVSYQFKWIYEPGQAPAGYDSAAWFPTTRRDSTFVVWTPGGSSMPTFVVRAIDDEGEPDPTPARQAFRFRNDPPTVVLTGPPPANTFPVTTISWSASDPDGDIADAVYLVWVDDQSANPAVVSGATTYTIPPSAFDDGAGGYVTGAHTVHVQAVDDGGATSPEVTATWNVVGPDGDVLLVDDVPSTLGTATDNAYRNALTRQLGAPPAYTIVNLETGNPFRSAADVTTVFGFFTSVIWYQDVNAFRSGTLPLAEPAIRSHLGRGGNFYLCSTIAVGTNGTLDSPAFLEEIVGADSVRVNTRVIPNSTSFTINTDAIIHPAPGSPYDSLRAQVIASGVDALILKNQADAAFEARPIVLDSLQTEPWIVGVDRIPAGGTGRLVLLTFPLRFVALAPPGAPAPPTPDANYAERTIRRVLARFGHGVAP